MGKMSMEVMTAITDSFEDMFEDEEAEYTYVSLNRENSDTGAENMLFDDLSSKVKTFAVLTTEENNSLLQSFKTYAKNMHIEYVQVEGEAGHSYICFNLTAGESKNIAELFGQNDFFYGKILNDGLDDSRHTAAKIYYYQREGSDGGYNLIDTVERVDGVRGCEEFFCRHGENKVGSYVKCVNEAYDNLKPIIDMECMNRALEENRIPKSRAYHRACAYKGRPWCQGIQVNRMD